MKTEKSKTQVKESGKMKKKIPVFLKIGHHNLGKIWSPKSHHPKPHPKSGWYQKERAQQIFRIKMERENPWEKNIYILKRKTQTTCLKKCRYPKKEQKSYEGFKRLKPISPSVHFGPWINVKPYYQRGKKRKEKKRKK